MTLTDLKGVRTYYIRGTFDFGGTGSDTPDCFQMLRGLVWTHTIGVEKTEKK